MGHHQAGRLNQAERLYLQILKIDPRRADALHFLGVLAHQIGRNLGNALNAQGKLPGRQPAVLFGVPACQCHGIAVALR